MNKEKLVLSVIAIILGLFVAGGAFYIYQMTRVIEEPIRSKTIPTQSPTSIPDSATLLILNEPKDEEVFNKRIINVKGKTVKGATVLVSTANIDQAITPSANGDFNLTMTIEDGVNILKVTAFFYDGTEKTLTRTVSSTTEDF